MIPVTLSIHGSTGVKQFHYEVFEQSQAHSGGFDGDGISNALHGVNEFGEEINLPAYRQHRR